MFAKTVAAFLLPALAAAQGIYGPAPGPSTPSSTTAAPVVIPTAPADSTGQHNINVGMTTDNVAFFYSPANISANVGDLVTFYFPGTIPHSVTQSTFASPCTYLAGNSSNSSSIGFDSGLVTASTFTINVTSTNPIWFHCRQLTHCGGGMVGSINAPSSGNQTYDAFKSAAIALGSNAPVETGTTTAVTGGVNAIATAAPASDTGAPSTNNNTSGSSKVVASVGVAFLSAVLAIMFV